MSKLIWSLFLLSLAYEFAHGVAYYGTITSHSCNGGAGCATNGDLITFFMPELYSTIHYVNVNGVACTSPYWTTPNTAISCTLSASSWSSGPVYVEILTEFPNIPDYYYYATGTFAITYANPTIASASCGSSGTTTCTTQGDSLIITGTNFGASGGMITLSADGLTNDFIQPTLCTHTGHDMVTCSGFEGQGIAIDVNFRRADAVSVTSYDAIRFPTASISSANCDGLCTTTGDSLTIRGSSFGPSGAQISISKSGTSQKSPTSCVAGDNAHTILICTGFEGQSTNIDVTITPARSTSVTLSAAFSFIGPEIVSYSCTSGVDNSRTDCATTGGVPITLYGTNFGYSGEDLEILVEGGQCNTPQIESHTKASCILPAGPVDSGNINMKQLLITNGGQNHVYSNFLYAAMGMSSSQCVGVSCHTHSDELTVIGSQFGLHLGTIEFTSSTDLKQPTCTRDSDTQFRCDSFEGSGTSITMTYTRTDGESITSSFDFTGPVIESYSCTAGVDDDRSACVTVGGVPITFKGTDFGYSLSDMEMYVEGALCLDQENIGHDQVACTLPAGPVEASDPEKWNLEIVIGGQHNVYGSFHYAPMGMSSSQCVGVSCHTHSDELTVIGSQFGLHLGTIEFTSSTDLKQPTCTRDSDTQFRCDSFEGSGTSITMTYTRTDGESITSSFDFTGPVIESYSCTAGVDDDRSACVTVGGVPITFKGTDFGYSLSDMEMYVEGALCLDQENIGHDQVACTLPAGPVEASDPEKWNLEIVIGGQHNVYGSFHYAPFVVDFSCCGNPCGVCLTESDVLTISGSQFGIHLPSVVFSGGAVVYQPTGCILVSHEIITCDGFEGAGTDVQVEATRHDGEFPEFPPFLVNTIRRQFVGLMIQF
eukprot:TRINITY_DN784_c0_g1_i9.p1 TRINITY_DN784_c0_g1~~TRINITY_DN784_c0_g1_i9.p1  ORF type:complete len:880 (-),score=183.71 TRINITY_DN784_c0_g1_i9:2712-5351(-)